jgi:two-component sensor histidine kinase
VTDVGRVALAARVFTIAALTSLAALAGPAYLKGALFVIVVAATAAALSLTRRLSQSTVAVLEGAAVAIVAALTYPDQATITPYLVIPALIGALDKGIPGLLRVTVTEFGLILVLWPIVIQRWDRELAATGFTWLATAIGIGLMGSAMRRTASASAGDADASYRSAVGLIRRLEALSGRLSGGLDAVGIAEQIMVEADALVPTRSAGVFVRSPNGSMAPLRYSLGTQPGAMSWAEPLAAKCWEYGAMVLRKRHVAIPLVANDEIIAVLVLDNLQDGVAQDVASLGYLVDNLAAGASDPTQQAQIRQLRQEVTRVVTELRHSIFDLRHEIAAGAGLGESLSAYANQVSATSPMTVHVTLDEKGPRLPGDVEYELQRIAQEAMANARKHSGAANLWLKCTVRAPHAEIEVGDDGSNAHAPRVDSQGLKIMRERARSIGADLMVEEPAPERPGTRVVVRVGPATANLPLEAGPETPGV